MSEPEFPSEMFVRCASRLKRTHCLSLQEAGAIAETVLRESGHAELVAALKAARPMVALNAALVSRACKCTTCVSGREALAAIDAALRKAGS